MIKSVGQGEFFQNMQKILRFDCTLEVKCISTCWSFLPQKPQVLLLSLLPHIALV